MSAEAEPQYAATPQQMQIILSNLMSLKIADAFLEPVDWKAWGLLDYPKIIKRPMDLGTMEGKLKAQKYESFADFKADLDLVVDNCLLYNEKSSDVYRQAVALRKAATKEMAKQLGERPARKSTAPVTPHVAAASAAVAATPLTAVSTASKTAGTATQQQQQHRAPALPSVMKPPGPDDKDKFCRNLFALSAVDLGRVIELVDEFCPGAIEGVGADEVDLNVDNIDVTTFKKADQLVRELHKRAKPSFVQMAAHVATPPAAAAATPAAAASME